MTLVVALRGREELVLAADSAAYIEHPGAMYRVEGHKLRPVNNGQWAVGTAGSDESLSLIEQLELRGFDFNQDASASLPSYARALWDEYKARGFSLDMDF